MDMYWEHLAVGASLPAMPLFLCPNRYVPVPLDAANRAAYRAMPAFWCKVLEGNPPGTA